MPPPTTNTDTKPRLADYVPYRTLFPKWVGGKDVVGATLAKYGAPKIKFFENVGCLDQDWESALVDDAKASNPFWDDLDSTLMRERLKELRVFYAATVDLSVLDCVIGKPAIPAVARLATSLLHDAEKLTKVFRATGLSIGPIVTHSEIVHHYLGILPIIFQKEQPNGL